GLAGVFQILGTNTAVTQDIDAGYGFDGITVALLGRANPLGTVLAGLLFGSLRTGGVAMQARTGTPIDLVTVVQALIVLFIAAPPLVRSMFRLPPERAGAGQVPATHDTRHRAGHRRVRRRLPLLGRERVHSAAARPAAEHDLPRRPAGPRRARRHPLRAVGRHQRRHRGADAGRRLRRRAVRLGV